MRNVREILRQKLELKRSHREVGKALGISNGCVGSLMVRRWAPPPAPPPAGQP